MPRITLNIEKGLLEKAQAYAHQHDLSLNVLICKLLEEKVAGNQQQIINAALALGESLKASSQGQTWSREDLYER